MSSYWKDNTLYMMLKNIYEIYNNETKSAQKAGAGPSGALTPTISATVHKIYMWVKKVCVVFLSRDRIPLFQPTFLVYNSLNQGEPKFSNIFTWFEHSLISQRYNQWLWLAYSFLTVLWIKRNCPRKKMKYCFVSLLFNIHPSLHIRTRIQSSQPSTIYYWLAANLAIISNNDGMMDKTCGKSRVAL